MIAVSVAQLFRLQQPSDTEMDKLSYYKLSLPLAALFQVGSIVVLLKGAWRCWRLQNAMLRGKIITASWETMGTGLIIVSVSLPCAKVLCLLRFVLTFGL
jgi:uncharacterized membrane protein YidH (DUF202 family)